MDVKAILLVGVAQDETGASGAASETVLGVPIAAFDVAGKPVAQRIAERLLDGGCSSVTIVADSDANIPATARQNLPARTNLVLSESQQLWRECERTFEQLSDDGTELVVVWRLGAYAEIDVEALIQTHLDQHARVTEVCDARGEPLGIFVLCGSRRNDAAYLFRHQLRASRMPSCGYVFCGYNNRLRTAADLRELTMDALLLRNGIRPVGTEIRPGVWLGAGARVQRGARLVAPCYIGAYARVRSAAVITRGSSIEHHAEVDCGTVVEGSNVLPYSYVGAGLDVCYSIVGYRKIAPLRRKIEVEVTDPKLVGMASEYAPLRALSTMGSLLAFVPQQVVRGLMAKPASSPPAELPHAVNAPSAALRETTGRGGSASEAPAQFPANMMVARRYGNE